MLLVYTFKLTLANNSLNRPEYIRHLSFKADTEQAALVMARRYAEQELTGYPHLVHPTELHLIDYQLTSIK